MEGIHLDNGIWNWFTFSPLGRIHGELLDAMRDNHPVCAPNIDPTDLAREYDKWVEHVKRVVPKERLLVFQVGIAS
jgi:hypothetical protein